MWFLTLINHLLNFVAPAAWLATGLLALHWLGSRRVQVAVRWKRHWLYLFSAGVAVLLAGLVVFGRDGKMMTYVALVVVMGVVQAGLARATMRRAAAESEASAALKN
ncbi:MAG: hypothetical protein Q4A11_04375 [Brachymonas sp.]|nr:hypothetical protein [Brachymonas sp.]